MCLSTAVVGALGALSSLGTMAVSGASAIHGHQEGKHQARVSRNQAQAAQAQQEEALRLQKQTSRTPGVRGRYAFGAGAQSRLSMSKGGTLLTGPLGAGAAGGKTLLGQ